MSDHPEHAAIIKALEGIKMDKDKFFLMMRAVQEALNDDAFLEEQIRGRLAFKITKREDDARPQ